MSFRSVLLTTTKRTSPARRCISHLSIAILLLCLGCGKTDEQTSPTSNRLQNLARVYLEYVAATGKGPENMEQLQAYRKNLPPFVVGQEPGDEPGDEWISERDGKPFEIRFGVAITDFSQVSKTLIASEKIGVDGLRLVCNLDGVVECLDETECIKRGVTQ